MLDAVEVEIRVKERQALLQGPGDEAGPDDLAVALAPGDVAAGDDGDEGLEDDEGAVDGGGGDDGELVRVLEVEGDVVEVGLVDGAEEKALDEHDDDGGALEDGYYID